MGSGLVAAGAVILLVPLAMLVWAIVTSLFDQVDGPVTFVRFFAVLALLVTVATAVLAPDPGAALVAGLVVAGLIALLFTALS